MTSQRELIEELERSSESLFTEISQVPEELFDRPPAKGRWSVAALTEHLLLLEKLVIQVLQGNCSERPGRAGTEKVELIREEMADRSNKMEASEPLQPSAAPGSKAGLIKQFRDLRQQLMALVRSEDLVAVCSGFGHHQYGPLTRFEWVVYTVSHGERHREQLQEIRQQLPG